MNKSSSFDQYRQRYSVAEKWPLNAGNTGNIHQVVVIPAYAEKQMLFSTLASLAANPRSSLDDSFVLCVINNKRQSPESVKTNNQQTMKYLDALIAKNISPCLNTNDGFCDTLTFIIKSGLRLGYVDAASPGYEIPDREGGVGMARKIGMDKALCLLAECSDDHKLIISLDADTLVEQNYLAAIRKCFSPRMKTAVIAYEHQEPAAYKEKEAIYCYEIFLRYWVLGLRYAKSSYAFHTIGSTIVCSASAYLEVRGMNRREAGEDFYFLNKLSKVGRINYIRNTCVYPSARASQRVPFGTGKRIHRFLSGSHEEYVLYDPRIFAILAQWLFIMNESFHYSEEEILAEAEQLTPLLFNFLKSCDFPESLKKIKNNVKDDKTFQRQMNSWFDGFKTLKLINYLSRELYPPVNMFTALEQIFGMLNIPLPENVIVCGHPDLKQQKIIIEYLRHIT